MELMLLFVSKVSFWTSQKTVWFFGLLSLVLQVVPEPVGQGKVGKKVESVAANAVPDTVTTELAQ